MRLLMCAVVTILLLCPVWAGGEIHGTITTKSGSELTGPIRWDRNENYWGDILHALKPERIEPEPDPRGGGLSFFGIKLGEDTHDRYNQFSIPFGHLKSIEPLGGRQVLLTLKNGEQVEVRSHSSDLGNGMRDLFIENGAGGRVDISWNRLKRVELRQGNSEVLDLERLYGEVTTGDGVIQGYVVWDTDESMLEDILDGEENDVDYEIAFRDIASIERQGMSSSKITLHDGTVRELRGTNDVEEGQRGVVVAVPGLGQVEMEWRDFEKVTFTAPPPSLPYSAFDGGRKLVAAVRTTDGQVHSGEIAWDQDETHTWETLYGQLESLNYAIPFSNILSIQRLNKVSSKVVLASGRVLKLSDAQDVGLGNRGVTLTAPDGSTTTIDWIDVDLVVF